MIRGVRAELLRDDATEGSETRLQAVARLLLLTKVCVKVRLFQTVKTKSLRDMRLPEDKKRLV